LFYSTTENDKEKVEIALKNGAKPSATDQHGYTPLMLAALKGNEEIAELLIEKGANINAKNNDGASALSKAVWYGDIECAELLLNRGADVNIMSHKWSLITTALNSPWVINEKNKCEKMAQLLLKYGYTHSDIESILKN